MKAGCHEEKREMERERKMDGHLDKLRVKEIGR